MAILCLVLNFLLINFLDFAHLISVVLYAGLLLAVGGKTIPVIDLADALVESIDSEFFLPRLLLVFLQRSHTSFNF